jgi:hypothetical protein
MWITRDIEPRLPRSARTRPVVVLTGARQTGKTSTFRRLLPGHEFVSLDLPTNAEQAEKEPQTFFQRHPVPVMIDDVQYAPGLFRYLKVAVDATRRQKGQFLLTGSQKFTLMKNVSESLAGRADIVELETLSLAEIRRALPDMRPESVIVRGGFPELQADPDIDHLAFYNSYLATYLERDVRSLAKSEACVISNGSCAPALCALRTSSIKPTWPGMWASLPRPPTTGCRSWRLRARLCCSSRGSRTARSPSSRVRNSTWQILDSFVRSSTSAQKKTSANRRQRVRSGKRSCLLSCGHANAGRNGCKVCSSGVTALVRWTSWLMLAGVSSCSRQSGLRSPPRVMQ